MIAGVYRLFANGYGPQCPVCGTRLKPGQMHTAESRSVQAHVSYDIDGVKYVLVAAGGGYGLNERALPSTAAEFRAQGQRGGLMSARQRVSR